MLFRAEPGKVYDSVFYFVEYFNYDYVEKTFLKAYSNSDFMRECFEEIKQDAGDVPALLAPFFYSDVNRKSVISVFMTKYFDFADDDIDSFLAKIEENSNILYRNTANSILRSSDNNDELMPTVNPDNYIDAINSSDFSESFKLQLALVMGNFSYSISVLTKWLKKVYLLIDALHTEHQREISLECEQIENPVNLQLYKNALKYEEEQLLRKNISISLLNQYIVFEKFSSSFLLLGLRHEEVFVGGFEDDSVATAQNFLLSCGSKIRLGIITGLMQNKEMTTSQMARYLDVPITTMIKHVNLLQNHCIIYISRRDKLQIFYSLNDKLLRKIKVDLDEMFSAMLSTSVRK